MLRKQIEENDDATLEHHCKLVREKVEEIIRDRDLPLTDLLIFPVCQGVL